MKTPFRALNSLANNVDLLSQLSEVSGINANYSDHLCRLKETIIPFLNQTVSKYATISLNQWNLHYY